MRRSVLLLSLACSLTLAGGCGGTKSALLKGSINTEAAANPDQHGRPSPIVVRVYELKGVGAFNSADFFSLFDKEAETLGSELIGREEYDLRPGETRPYQRQLQPDTKFIGVISAFQDLENSRWRDVAPVPAKRNVAVTIGIKAKAVTLAVK